MVKVSVIIPCYNHGQYIDEAVDSILNQTFQGFEILVINDGSTDEFTIEKLCNYNKPKTTVLHHTINQGVPSARNHGIRVAQGEYILTLDADDWFEPTFLEKAVHVLDQQPQIGAVCCGVNQFGTINRKKMPQGGGVKNFIIKCSAPSQSLFRKICWDQAGGYNDNMRQGYNDWEFWLNVTKRGWQIYVIQEYLLNYRRHLVSLTTKAHKIKPFQIRQLVQNHREVFERYVDEVIFEHEKKILALNQNNKALLNSRSYRLGKCILAPCQIVRRIFKH